LNETSLPEKRRRGPRVVMRVPVEVRGTTQDGSVLEESTHTSVVGSLGAMIRTSRCLQMDTEVSLTNRFSQQTQNFRVAWIGEQQADGLWEIGLEALQPLDDFWGVRFPPRPTPG
jgi:hypothetical protein